jgi:DNA-binding transcriptional LysR family regulator
MEDWIPLRDGVADLSVCILGHFPQEFRTRQLFTDRFVCVVRGGHPRVGKRLTLDQYLSLDHIVVSPLGRPSAVDRALAERGYARRIRRVVPLFNAGLLMAASTDDVLTVSDRAALALAPTLGLRLLEPPLPLAAYSLNLLWHPRLDNEPANRWLRDVFVRAAAEAAPDAAAGPAPGNPNRRRRQRRRAK